MVLGIQIVGVFFGVFMIYYTFLQRKRNEFTTTEYLFWTILWLLFMSFAIFPNMLNPAVKTFKLARTMDFFIIAGFIFLTGAVFYTYTIVRKSQQKIEKVVREIAIRKK